MSEFASYSNALSRLDIFKPADFVSEASLPSLANKYGALGVKLLKQVTQIKKCVELLSKHIEKISGGPAIEIGEIYESIKLITEKVNNNINELDNYLPTEYHCKPVFDQAISNLGQLDQYIPHLISTNAPSLAQYITNFQQICVTTNQVLDQIISVYQSIPLLIQNIVNPLPSSSPLHNLLMGALIHLSESISTNLICFTQETNVKSSEPTVQCLQAWQTILENFAMQLQASMGQPHAQAVNAISYVSVEPATSLFETLNAVHMISPNSLFFEDATASAVAFTQFLNEIEYIEFSEMARDLTSTIATYVTEPGKPIDDLFQRAQILIVILSNRLKTARFGIQSGDSMSAVFALSLSLPGYKDNVIELVQSTVQALIVYSGICGMRKDGIAVLNSLYTQCLSVLSYLGQQLQDLATEMNTIVATKEAVFNVKKLGTLNYHIKKMSSIEFPLGDDFLNASKVIAGFAGCIGRAVSVAVENVSDDETVEKLNELSQKANSIGVHYIRWMQKAVLCNTVALETRGELLAALSPSFASIASTIQAIPRYLAFEVGGESRLISMIADTIKSIPSLTQTSEHAEAALKQVSEEAFASSNFLQPLSKVADQMEFTAAVSGMNALSLPYYALSAQVIAAVPQAFSYVFATAYTQSMIVTFLIESLPSFSTRLVAYPSSVRGALDVMWPNASGLAYGHQAANKDNLSMYLASISRTVQEIDSAIAQLPAPSIAYEISDTLKQMRAMEGTISSLPASLKETAKEALKIAWKSPDGIPIITLWFDAAKAGIKDTVKALEKLIEVCLSFISGAQTDSLYQDAVSASVALAAAELDDESLESILDGMAIKLLQAVIALAKDPPKVRLLLQLAYEGIHGIKIRNLKTAEIENHVTSALLGIAGAYLDIITNNMNPQTLAGALKAVSVYKAINAQFENFSLVQEDADRIESDLQVLLKAESSESINPLYKNACKMYTARCRSAFAGALGTDLDSLIDSVYDFSELSRTTANAILKESKSSEESQIYIRSTVRRFVSSAASVVSISERALESLHRDKTQLMEMHIIGSCEILQSLITFVENANAIGAKALDQIDLPLRRSNRNVAKQIDSFINFIETPPAEDPINDDFEKLRMAMYAAIGSLECDVAKVISDSSLAISEDTYAVVEVPKSVKMLNDAFEQVKAKAVGKTKNNFVVLFGQLKTAVNAFFNSSPDFSLPFSPQPVIEAAARLGSSLARFMAAASEATDVLVIDPDPVSASAVPEAFKAPAASASSIPAVDAYPEQSASYSDFVAAVNQLKEQSSKEIPNSEEILAQITAVSKAAEKYCQSALATAAGTPEAAAKVEQQTSVHAVAAAVTTLLGALKAFFLRSGNFESELSEAFAGVIAAVEESNRLGEAASKIVIAEEAEEAANADDDEVTAELRASAAAISDMSARLAAFGAQLNVADAQEEVVIEDDIDDNELDDVPEDPQDDAQVDLAAEEGTLAAFVIQNSTPVMKAAGAIVIRAQEICSQLRGLIKNERLLIKCAQDLSEAAELMIIAAEIVIQAEEQDPEFKVIAASRIVRTACAKLVAQVRQEGDDPEGVMEANIRTVRAYTAVIIKKIDKISRHKWREADAKSTKKVMNKMVARMNAGAKLQEYQKNLQNEENALKQLMRKG